MFSLTSRPSRRHGLGRVRRMLTESLEGLGRPRCVLCIAFCTGSVLSSHSEMWWSGVLHDGSGSEGAPRRHFRQARSPLDPGWEWGLGASPDEGVLLSLLAVGCLCSHAVLLFPQSPGVWFLGYYDHSFSPVVPFLWCEGLSLWVVHTYEHARVLIFLLPGSG